MLQQLQHGSKQQQAGQQVGLQHGQLQQRQCVWLHRCRSQLPLQVQVQLQPLPCRLLQQLGLPDAATQQHLQATKPLSRQAAVMQGHMLVVGLPLLMLSVRLAVQLQAVKMLAQEHLWA